MVADFPLSEVGRDLMLSHFSVDTEDLIEGMDKWVSTKAIDYMDEAGRRYGVTAFFFEDKAPPGRTEMHAQVVDVLAEGNTSH